MFVEITHWFAIGKHNKWVAVKSAVTYGVIQMENVWDD